MPSNVKQSYVYIMSSGRNGTLYIGVTSDLARRVYQHQNSQGSVFTSRYRVRDLVYYEVFEDIAAAIVREKQLKAWKRRWKIRIIEAMNPEWRDLCPEIVG